MRTDWERETFGRNRDVISGGTPPTGIPEYWDGDIVWITPADLSKVKYPLIDSSNRRITQAGIQNSGATLIPRNSIVMSSRAPIGYFAVPQIEFTTNQGCKSIAFREGHDPIYHYYNFIHRVNRFKNRGEGTTFAEISKKVIEKLEFEFPPLPQQRKIARILSTCDAVIEKTEAAIAKYRALKQGLMHDLFTRGIDLNTGHLRPKYEEAPELYKPARLSGGESELGWIPKEWEVKNIQSYLQLLKSGLSRLLSQQHIGVPVMISGNIQDGKLGFERFTLLVQGRSARC
ncbi:MAG: restriction endonuclease subunit S [Owenweeksia sp.]|nr:restriction endonuclease subunit S [Owenweeksia sp.]